MSTSRQLWPHQATAIASVTDAIESGHRRILLTSPTGAGKTEIVSRLIIQWAEEGHRVALYTNRKLLLEQLSESLDNASIDHGVRAAGHPDEHHLPVQICSMPTEVSRTRNSQKCKGEWSLHQCTRVVIDEAHLHKSTKSQEVLAKHCQEGAVLLGVTATPIDLAHCYDTLIQAGTTSQLRRCGALVWAHYYGPDEPDLSKLSGWTEGTDLSEEQQRQVMGPRPQLWGRVWEWFETLNPDWKPTILFAPGVPESIWFAQEFTNTGCPAAHIDGQNIWLDGYVHPSSPELRRSVLDRLKKGELRVVTNRFVLREGIDIPYLEHCILATAMGSTQTYIQSVGRVLRAYEGLQSVTIQDHGGNWHRHGCPNQDRIWNLSDSSTKTHGSRIERMRLHNANPEDPHGEPEPRLCPICRYVLNGPPREPCPECGFVSTVKARRVIQSDGRLVEINGSIYKPRRMCKSLSGIEKWKQMYWRSRTKSGARTFNQAFALFAMENGWQWPNPKWPLMPKNPDDRWLYVKDVPLDHLTGDRI